MTALESAILTAAIKQAKSIGNFQIGEVLIGLLLADQPTRDAFIKQAAADSQVILQAEFDTADADAAAKKAALDASIKELDTVVKADVPVDPSPVVITPVEEISS